MSNEFMHVKNGDDLSSFTSQGMDVFVNCAKANLNILGTAVYPGNKFATSRIDERLERYIRKGQAKLVANGLVVQESVAAAVEAQKPKKKKTTDESQEVEQIVEEQKVVEEPVPAIENDNQEPTAEEIEVKVSNDNTDEA